MCSPYGGINAPGIVTSPRVMVQPSTGQAESGAPGDATEEAALRELMARYGRWAVTTAAAICPRGDIRCIERESRRLHQSTARRR